jgi:glycosyltransferase involved in cell wall biosynthesis
MEKPIVSIVIPTYNEVDTVESMARAVAQVMERIGTGYEILFIDDGSTDGSFEAMAKLAEQMPTVRVVQFRRNFGKAAALTAGFHEALGEIIVTMDADLQDEPQDIPKLLDGLEKGGYDLVSGWKWPRLDPLEKTLPSRLFNKITARVSGVPLHDFNSGFKAYRREALEDISIYGELYRYLPVLVHRRGFKIGEVQVKHNPRRFGRSKYGFSRYLRGFFDLLTITFLTRYRRSPLYLFGRYGLAFAVAGAGILIYLAVLWFMGVRPIGDRPLLIVGVLLSVLGVQFISLGLIAEMITNATFNARISYTVKRKIR